MSITSKFAAAAVASTMALTAAPKEAEAQYYNRRGPSAGAVIGGLAAGAVLGAIAGQALGGNRAYGAPGYGYGPQGYGPQGYGAYGAGGYGRQGYSVTDPHANRLRPPRAPRGVKTCVSGNASFHVPANQPCPMTGGGYRNRPGSTGFPSYGYRPF